MWLFSSTLGIEPKTFRLVISIIFKWNQSQETFLISLSWKKLNHHNHYIILYSGISILNLFCFSIFLLSTVSWVTLLLAVIFSLLSLICIIWIIGAICKACSRKTQYKNVKPVDQPEEDGESIRSIRSFTSIPYNAAPRNCD